MKIEKLDENGWSPLGFTIESQVRDDAPSGCAIVAYAFGYRLEQRLPNIFKPYRKIHFPNWDAATINRLGRNHYYEYHSKEYGFRSCDGFFQLFLGAQTHDSITTQSWSAFIPWQEWRFVRLSYYDLEGSVFFQENSNGGRERSIVVGSYSDSYEASLKCPKKTFLFYDFDGEEITVDAYVEEREWLFGSGWFKWLSVFRKPKIRRDLDLRFSSEVGRKRGSWKGGTIGSSVTIEKGEEYRVAFMRYCAENDMVYLGEAA